MLQGIYRLLSYGARDLVNNFREFEEQPMIGYD